MNESKIMGCRLSTNLLKALQSTLITDTAWYFSGKSKT